MNAPRHAVVTGALALGVALAVPACDGAFTDPSPGDSAAVAVSFSLDGSAGGDAQAFDQADAARVRLQRRTGGAPLLDQQFPLAANQAGREVSLELQLSEDPEVLDLSAQLLAAGQTLFAGSTAVTVRQGQTTAAEVPLQAVAASVSLSRQSATLTAINQTLPVSAFALFATGDTARSLTVQWTSQNAAIVTVSANGVLTAHAEGETRVVASAGTASATLQVLVKADVRSVTVSPATDSLNVGEEVQLAAMVRDANGTALVRTPVWSSNNPSIASVTAGGRVRGLTRGTATITATVEGVTGSAQITVLGNPDLVIASGTPVPAPSVVSPGGTVVMPAWSVTNQGTAAAGPFASAFYLSTDAVITASDVFLADAAADAGLAAGATSNKGTQMFTIPAGTPAGNYWIGMLADRANAVQESNENNNHAAAPLTVVVPVLVVTPASLTFSGVQGGSDPAGQTISISNGSGGTLLWSVADDVAWLTLAPTSGPNAGTVTATASVTGLAAGTYTGTITVTGNAGNSPRTVPVTLNVAAGGGQLRGRVTDLAGLPLAGAQVAVQGTGYASVTNATGDYLISLVPPGSYSVSAAMVGYVTQVVNNVVVTGGQTTTLNFQLGPALPAPPTGLTAVAASSSRIDLAWTDAASNETGFRIERCTGAGCTSFVEIATVGADVTTYPNTGLAAGTSYSYRVRAYNAGGSSAYSNTATATTLPTAPAAPSALTSAPASASQVNLQWADNAANESGFRIERCTGAGCASYTEIATVGANVTTYQSSGLSGSTTFGFRVLAYNTGGSSAYSNTTTATTPAPEPTTVPAPPSGLSVTAASSTQVDVAWTDNATNEIGWRHERCAGAGCSNFTEVFVPTTTTPPATGTLTTSYTGQTPASSYTYRIRTFNRVGNSGYSNTATAVTPSNPVTVPAAPTGLAATAVSRKQVTLSWTDNAGNEAGVRVERCTGAGCGSFAQIGTLSYANQTTYRDTSAVTGTYVYRIRAYNTIGNSGYSNTATVTTSLATTPPSAPSSLYATAVSASTINLGWTDNSSNEDGFYIERSTCSTYSCGPFTLVATSVANVTGWQIAGHAAGTVYSYRVRAFNTAGSSNNSNTATAITW